MPQVDPRQGYEAVTVVIYDRKRDETVQDLSLVAYQKETGKVMAVGREALRFQGAEPAILVRCPMRRGVVADYTVFQAMMQAMLSRTQILKSLGKPKLAVCVPPDLTEVEQKAFQEAFYQAGVKKLVLSEESMERTSQSLPSDFRAVIGFRWEQLKDPARGERWKELGAGAIPWDVYQTLSVQGDPSDLALTACGIHNRVGIRFHQVIAARMLDQAAAGALFGSQEARERMQRDQGQHILYEIEGGAWPQALNGTMGQPLPRDFVVLSRDSMVEVLTDQEPEIQNLL